MRATSGPSKITLGLTAIVFGSLIAGCCGGPFSAEGGCGGGGDDDELDAGADARPDAPTDAPTDAPIG